MDCFASLAMTVNGDILKYCNIINGICCRLARNPATHPQNPTFHGAFAANGLKRAYLIQFRRAMWPAQLTATAASTVCFAAFSMFPAR